MTDYVAHVNITANLWHEEPIKRDFFSFLHQLYFALQTSYKQSVGITKLVLVIGGGWAEANILSESVPEVFLRMMTSG